MSNAPLDVSVGEIFGSGVRGYSRNVVALSSAALVTLASYAAFRIPAQSLYRDDRILLSIAVDLVGLIVGGTLAYPWYSYALDAADGRPVDLRKPFATPKRFLAQGVGSFWFWAAVLLGFRYLFGIPSLMAILFYAFFGFVIADGQDSGLKALGTSVRLGQGKRTVLFAMMGLFLVFNLLGAIALGYGQRNVHYALAVVGLVITTSITLVSGAVLYRSLNKSMKPTSNQRRKS